jgi:hypothetical protein
MRWAGPAVVWVDADRWYARQYLTKRTTRRHLMGPVLLGRGNNAFAGIDMAQPDLVEAQSSKNGLVWRSSHRR